MIPCKHCCSSGNKVVYPNYIIKCNHCQGTGQVNEEEYITVPRKYVKDEYFENNYLVYKPDVNYM